MSAPNFPTNDAADAAAMLQGRSQVFIGPYTAPTAGVPNDAAELYYMGLVDDGIEQTFGVEYEDVDGGAEFLAPFTTFRTVESMDLAFTIRELKLENLGIILGGSATFSSTAGPVSIVETVDNVSGDETNLPAGVARELAIGGVIDCPAFYQIVLRHPAQGDGTTCGGFEGWSITWKGLIRPAGAITRTRRGIHTLAVTVTGYVDSEVEPSVVTTPLATTAYGNLGLVHYPNA